MAELENKGFILLRKIPTCVAALTAACLLAGCQPVEQHQQVARGSPILDSNPKIIVWTDAFSGCSYLIYASYKQGGITPRLTADGLPECRNVVAPAAASQAGTDERSEGVDK